MISTSKEQSERILACGISPSTSDMYYLDDVLIEETCNSDGIPSWSFEQLLSLLPKRLDEFKCTLMYNSFNNGEKFYEEESSLIGNLMLGFYDDGDCYIDYDFYGFLGRKPCSESPIEAVVQAIELLYINGYKF